MLVVLLILGLLIISFGVIVLLSFLSHKKKGLGHDEEFVRKLLPGVDCGMCRESSCDKFACKVAAGKKEPTDCKLIKPQNSEKIKAYFKPTYKPSSKLVAFVRCKGGCKAQDKYIYEGAHSCSVEEMLHSGSKACKFACLGCGDCAAACKYDAIKISKRGVAEVDRGKCTGCGACVASCPNNIIIMKRLDLSVGVVCNNKSNDPAATEKCSVSCTHCGACVKTCPVGAIKMVDNIPVIDPDKCIECYKCVSVCPSHVISRL